MRRLVSFAVIALVLFVMAACGAPSASATPALTNTSAAQDASNTPPSTSEPATAVPSNTPTTTATNTRVPTNTVAPTDTIVPTNTFAPTDTVVPTDTLAPTNTFAPTDTITPTNTSTEAGGGAIQATTANGPTQIAMAQEGGSRILVWNPNLNALQWFVGNQPTEAAKSTSPRALAIPCLTSPSGNSLVIHLGGDQNGAQSIIPLDGSTPVALGENSGLACGVRGGIQFSPDGARLGTLQFSEGAQRENFAIGKLIIRAVADGAQQASISDVTSFSMYSDGALALQFFPNSKGEANSADLRWWDGNKERVIASEFAPKEGCQFVNGRALKAEDKVYLLMAERCPGKGSNWRLVRMDFAGGNAADVATGNAPGAYFSKSSTNNMWLMPGGKELLIVYPNGDATDIANLARIKLADGEIKSVINGVVVDAHPPVGAPRFRFSLAGDKLLMISRGGNRNETLYYWDLMQPDTAPVKVAGGNRPDRINGVSWVADGSRFFYVITGDANALYTHTVANIGERKLVVRGQFEALAVNPNGSFAAVAETNRVSNTDVRSNLVLVNINDQSKTTLVEGKKGEAALTPLVIQ